MLTLGIFGMSWIDTALLHIHCFSLRSHCNAWLSGRCRKLSKSFDRVFWLSFTHRDQKISCIISNILPLFTCHVHRWKRLFTDCLPASMGWQLNFTFLWFPILSDGQKPPILSPGETRNYGEGKGFFLYSELIWIFEAPISSAWYP